MPKRPWASGPSEILQHGLSLLDKDSDSNRRLAMLSIDNAVELTIKTFLSLPRRVTGLNLSRKEYQEISESFPQLLDALEKHAKDKLDGIDLGEIEWFHRLRNELYHQGNGLTVDKDKVEIYAELAKILFRNLFGFDVEVSESTGYDLLGSFLAEWVEIEKILLDIASKNIDVISAKSRDMLQRGVIPFEMSRELSQANVVPKHISIILDELRQLRNATIHGKKDYRKMITPEIVSRTKLVANDLRKIAKS